MKIAAFLKSHVISVAIVLGASVAAAGTQPGATCLRAGNFPPTLVATGCYADLRHQRPAAEFVPYEINAPLWTDGAIKRRYMSVPAGQTASVAADGSLDLPRGAVLMKEFRLVFATAGVAAERPVETRLMRRGASGWEFATYRWNDAGTDGVLLDRHLDVTLEVGAPGALREQVYGYPSANECRYCHSESASQVLGPTIEQLDRMVRVAGRESNQLVALQARGVLDAKARLQPAAVHRIVDPGDPRASLEQRARSYLHANCAHCHRPGGWSPPPLTLDLRFDRSLAQTRTCRVATQYWETAPRVAPGRPEVSALWRRLRSHGLDRMPPFGSNERDPGADVVRDWIASLDRCPPD